MQNCSHRCEHLYEKECSERCFTHRDTMDDGNRRTALLRTTKRAIKSELKNAGLPVECIEDIQVIMHQEPIVELRSDRYGESCYVKTKYMWNLARKLADAGMIGPPKKMTVAFDPSIPQGSIPPGEYTVTMTGARTGRIEQEHARIVRAYAQPDAELTVHFSAEQKRNAEFAEWFEKLCGSPPQPRDFSNRSNWARFQDAKKSKPTTMEGQNTVTNMSRQQLLDMQAAAARQLAETESQLKKYEAFPTETEVLAVGDVLRFSITRTYERNVVPEVVSQFVNLLERTHGQVPVNYAAARDLGPKETVSQTYDYAAIYVPDDEMWYTTGAKSKTRLSYDDLVKMLVDAGTKNFQVYSSSARTFGTLEAEPVDHVTAAREAVDKAREHVAAASKDLEARDADVAADKPLRGKP